MRYAQLSNDGVVMFVFESNTTPPPFENLIDITGNTEISPGWEYGNIDRMKERKKQEIASARFEAETAEIDVNGFRVRTDRESQALITGAALKAMQDSEYSCRWKGVDGFIELTAPQILAIADAVRAHVQSCFDREAELCGLIDKAESPEELGGIMW